MERATGSADETNQMSHADGGNLNLYGSLVAADASTQQWAKCLRAVRFFPYRKLSRESLKRSAGALRQSVNRKRDLNLGRRPRIFLDYKGEYLLEEPRL